MLYLSLPNPKVRASGPHNFLWTCELAYFQRLLQSHAWCFLTYHPPAPSSPPHMEPGSICPPSVSEPSAPQTCGLVLTLFLASQTHTRHVHTHMHTYYRTSQTARQFIYHKLISGNAEGLDLIHPTVPSSVASPRMCLMFGNCWLKAGTAPECKPMPLVSKWCPSTLNPFVWILHIYFLIWEVWMFKLLPPLGVGAALRTV